MSNENKLGTYIENLMCVIVDVDKEQKIFGFGPIIPTPQEIISNDQLSFH